MASFWIDDIGRGNYCIKLWNGRKEFYCNCSTEELEQLRFKINYVLGDDCVVDASVFPFLDSPLEIKLFSALCVNGLMPYCLCQYQIDHNGDWVPGYDSKNILTRVDFYFPSARLCVAVDGFKVHHSNEFKVMNDNHIDAELQRLGYKTRHFSNSEIENEIDWVIDIIKSYLK